MRRVVVENKNPRITSIMSSVQGQDTKKVPARDPCNDAQPHPSIQKYNFDFLFSMRLTSLLPPISSYLVHTIAVVLLILSICLLLLNLPWRTGLRTDHIHHNMSRTRIIPSSLRSSLLSRKHRASILRPPNLPSIPGLPLHATTRIGIHPNGSHLSLPPFAALRAFSTSAPRSSTTPSYNYSVSAAYSDKRHKLDLARNHFSYSPLSRISHITPPETERPRAASGQDAYFISGIGETSSLAFGVVDGVGGWEESGVDPADFAHSLCDYMADAAARYPYGLEKVGKSSAGSVRPVELLDVGYERVMDDKAIAAGGCTACVATVTGSGQLSVAKYVYTYTPHTYSP
jgi:hypothetical protein